jgi:cytochrome c oxidase cbb3-type subunit 2
MNHKQIEKHVGLMGILIVVAISFGGLVEILPLMFQHETTRPSPGTVPLTALQQEGRDIYVREGCYLCHSQMIRPFRAETERYGPYSTAGEFVYDRPFQWGSKRTGPDLHRVGGRYTDEWHRVHLIDPRAVVPESNMPGFPWLAGEPVDAKGTRRKLEVLRMLGHPYTDAELASAEADVTGRTELDALVAYLQSLGVAGRKAAAAAAVEGP